MPNVYTELLFTVSNGGPGNVVSDTVPSGFVWVVRDVTVTTPGIPFSNDGGWELYSSSGPIFGATSGETCGGRTFYWEGRQVVDTGDHLTFHGVAAGYGMAVSGYVLTLP